MDIKESFADVDLVMEVVVEIMEVKRKVCAELEGLVKPEAYVFIK